MDTIEKFHIGEKHGKINFFLILYVENPKNLPK